MPDSATYLRMAEEIQKGHWHIDLWGRGGYSGVPLYPLLVAMTEWLIPGFETAGTVVAIVAASAVVVPLFFLTRDSYGEKAALVVIPLTLLNPSYLEYIVLPLTEAFFTLLILAGIFLAFCAITKDSPILWLATGVTGGAAWMTRDVGIIFPFLSFSWFAVSIWRNNWLFPKVIRNGVALLLGVVLISLPLKLVMTMDKKGASHPSPNLSVTVNLMAPDLRDSMKREIYFGELTGDSTEYAFVEAQKNPPKLKDILGHWDWIIQRLGYNLYEMVRSVWGVLGFSLLPFVLIGILKGKGLHRQESKGFPGVVLFLCSYILSYLLFYALAGGFTGAIDSERYLVPLIPLWGIWASAGILLVGNYMERFNIKHLGKLILLLFIGMILIRNLPSLKQARRIYQERMQVAEFYKGLGTRLHGMEHMVIMARTPFLPYYAGASWAILPYGEYQDIIKFARARHVDFLYMEGQLASSRPQLSFLLKSNVSVSEMEKVYYLSNRGSPKDLLAVLYRIKK